MPLKAGSSQKTVSANIEELHGGATYSKTLAKHGKDTANKQSIAIALDKARERARGGATGRPGPAGAFSRLRRPKPPIGVETASSAPVGVAFAFGGAPGIGANSRPTAPHMTKGSILSAVPGRTDAHATHVPSGSYVIPADIVSGRGQGNTIAGAKALEKMFKMGPYGVKPMPIKSGPGAPGRHRAAGGATEEQEVPVRVNLAGGEIVVPPANLQDVVHQDLKTAHRIMDRWVLDERKNLRKTLAKLPGPVVEK